MAPDVEELIKRVNTLTLDKNRLKQRLTQLNNEANNQLSQRQRSSLDASDLIKQLSSSLDSPNEPLNTHIQAKNALQVGVSANDTSPQRGPSSGLATQSGDSKAQCLGNFMAGVQCTTSSEDDLLYVNSLLKSRLEEYQENWDFIQSKCTALLSELNALQKHFAILKREKLQLEEKLKSKCDEHDKVTSELQTVVLNYEVQLSAMSEHLSMITSQVNLDDSNT